jgi:hypothetical protein
MIMIRSLVTHAAFVLHAVVLTVAIALAVTDAEKRPVHYLNQNTPKQSTPKQNPPKSLLFPALSQRQFSMPSSPTP